MFTLTQFLALQSGNFAPPWRASDLFKTFKARSLSLRSLISTFGKQKVAYCVEVRSINLLQGVQNLAELQQKWLNRGNEHLAPPGILAGEFDSIQNNIFAPHGVALKMVATDFIHAVLIGN